jgi:hypothetical protein
MACTAAAKSTLGFEVFRIPAPSEDHCRDLVEKTAASVLLHLKKQPLTGNLVGGAGFEPATPAV